MREIGAYLVWMLFIALGGLSCEGRIGAAQDGGAQAGADAGMSADPVAPVDGAPAPGDPRELIEDPSVYEQDDLEVRAIHLTVDDLDGLEDVHDNVRGAEVEVLFQEGDFGRGQTAPNGELRLRGATARDARQKSYRIKLDSEAGLWRGYRIIHLNKHPWDLVRVRQQLSFDYFKEIRHLTSLRTGFVRLFINDEDMGFYTQVERPDERFLAAHGLDPAGQVYKAKEYRFEQIPEEVWDDPEALEEILEAKANPDHDKFREMLAAVHDQSRDIDEVIDTYFHRDNYLTWWAMNILMGNFDTVARNYLLYSPSGSRRWYFMQWDYDDCWGVAEQPGERPRARHKAGVGNWWFSHLHRRFLLEPGNVDELSRMVERLADEVITPARTAALLARYHDIVRDNVAIPPDIEHLPADDADTPEDKMAVFEDEYARLPGKSELFREEFYAAMGRPMPVRMDPAEVDGERVRLSWSPSFDLQGDAITYEVVVSTSPDFEEDEIVARRTGLETTYEDLSLPEGTYFARVIIRDDANPGENWQHCANLYYDSDERRMYWGAIRVEVD